MLVQFFWLQVFHDINVIKFRISLLSNASQIFFYERLNSISLFYLIDICITAAKTAVIFIGKDGLKPFCSHQFGEGHKSSRSPNIG